MASISPIPPFDPDGDFGTSMANRWRIWIDDFKTYLVASNIKDNIYSSAIYFCIKLAPDRVREIFRQLKDTGNDDDFELAVTKLTEHFEPQVNRLYEIYCFRKTV